MDAAVSIGIAVGCVIGATAGATYDWGLRRFVASNPHSVVGAARLVASAITLVALGLGKLAIYLEPALGARAGRDALTCSYIIAGLTVAISLAVLRRRAAK